MGTGTIRIVRGRETGPTAVASYDAALADAGVHNYNLRTLSSVVPADAEIDVVGTAPDLGPPGECLTIVQAMATVEGTGRATAALGWTRSEGPGVFYETGGEFDEAEARRRIRQGLEHAKTLRGWTFEDERIETASLTTDGDSFATAVVLAVYGTSDPVL